MVCFMYIAPPIGETRERHAEQTEPEFTHTGIGIYTLVRIQEYLTSRANAVSQT